MLPRLSLPPSTSTRFTEIPMALQKVHLAPTHRILIETGGVLRLDPVPLDLERAIRLLLVCRLPTGAVMLHARSSCPSRRHLINLHQSAVQSVKPLIRH